MVTPDWWMTSSSIFWLLNSNLCTSLPFIIISHLSGKKTFFDCCQRFMYYIYKNQIWMEYLCWQWLLSCPFHGFGNIFLEHKVISPLGITFNFKELGLPTFFFGRSFYIGKGPQWCGKTESPSKLIILIFRFIFFGLLFSAYCVFHFEPRNHKSLEMCS